MSAAELKRLKEARGKWCFPGGKRTLRLDRIRELEAKKPKAKKKGKADEKSEAGTPEEG
tara:strand:- start:1024 stop:1200 length:177 start_codon:yes stop_codon:yes gene_type:complete